ncbi:hypothetical protein [Jhaorihella thermophila]|uniref:Uncharacterized protein n=1 Tax=Jhaorihella thermophila TaxID=488547 RepID=A0A1H5S9M1_9RHOB|nr:hypothetical protein [Jhaorihella thermophila]SEF46517.1 hypothetical protein SAMN05421751_101379 [Jhaorihella thermophila]
MRFFHVFAAVLTFAVAAQPAYAFTSRNGARVNQVDAAVFEVVPRGASNGPDIWCAASEYARMQLGASWSAEIFVVRGRGPSVTTNRRTAVQFTLDPAAAGVTPSGGSISLNSLKAGEHMSVQLANTQCNVPFGRF